MFIKHLSSISTDTRVYSNYKIDGLTTTATPVTKITTDFPKQFLIELLWIKKNMFYDISGYFFINSFLKINKIYYKKNKNF